MAYDEQADDDLVALDVAHLFESSVTMIGCRRGTFLRGFMYDFIESFAPHLSRDKVEQALALPDQAAVDAFFLTKRCRCSNDDARASEPLTIVLKDDAQGERISYVSVKKGCSGYI